MDVRLAFTISMALVAFTSGLLGIFVLLSSKEKIPRAFASIALTTGGWALFTFLWQILDPLNQQGIGLILFQIGIIFVTLLSAAFINFATYFTETIVPTRSYAWVRRISLCLATVISLLIVANFFIGTHFVVAPGGPKGPVGAPWFQFWPDPGQLFLLHFGYFGGSFILGFLLLLSLLKKAKPDEQGQIKNIVGGIALAVITGGTIYLIWFNIPFPPLGGWFVPVYVFSIFYSITRHKLFNIRIFVAELLIFALWILILLLIALKAVPYVNTLIFGAVVIFGILLARSVFNEIKQRERSEMLSTQLSELNNTLQQKVEEQTHEIRAAYEVEKKARLELEELDKAKDQFILTTQHHLRTPLTIIKGFIDTALFKKEKILDAETNEYLNKASTAADRMAKLINDFLGVSQLEVGKAIFNFQPGNIKMLIEEIKTELMPEIEKKHLVCNIVFSEEAETTQTQIDKGAIKAALYNLIDNSVKYTQVGEVTITGTIVVHPIEKNKILRIEIKDTGIGIAPEELPKLFTQYFQRGEEAEKIYTTGRGIGLVLGKNIIKAHHGEVTVQSKGKGKGSTFIVELPAI